MITNGHVPEGDSVIRQATKRLAALGDVARDVGTPVRQGQTPPPDDGPLRRVTRHPEDPPDGYERTAREVCDPEEIRVNAVATGKTSQALAPEVFHRYLQRAFKGISGVRSGAITGPAASAGGDQLKISTTTSKDVERIVSDRSADGVKADRLQADAVPRTREKIDRAEIEVEKTEEHLRATHKTVGDVRAEGLEEDSRPGELAQWIRLPPLPALLVTLLDIVITAIVLEPAVSDLIATQFAYGSLLIAAGVSASLIVASAAAGFTVAAIRLPGRAVGAFMTALFGLVMLKFVGGLDALRAGSEAGVETLTAVTLASCYVAALTGYATGTWQDFAIERERILAAGTPLGDALSARQQARDANEAAKANLAKAEAELDDLWAEIERLRDSAARANAAVLTREQQGIAADIEFAAIDSRARTGVAQEVAANEEWGVSMALLAYEKARAEQLPEGDAVQDQDAPAPPPPPADREDHGLTGLQKAGIGTLGAGVVGGLVLGPIALAAGAGLAATLLTLGRRRRRASLTVEAEEGASPGPRPIGATASDEDPSYIRQADRMVAEYGDGGAMIGEHQ